MHNHFRNVGICSAIFAVLFMVATTFTTPANASDIHPEVDKLVEQLAKTDVLIKAIIGGDPAKKEELKRRLSDAYRAGGEAGLQAEATKIGEEFGQVTVFATIPKAQPQDVTNFVEGMVSIMRYLETTNASACYRWLYGDLHGDPIPPNQFIAVIGDDRMFDFILRSVAIVNNAYTQPVTYDRIAAQLRIQRAVQSTLSLLDQGTIQVIAGMRAAQTQAEMAGACRGTGDLYGNILSQEAAADTLRELFRPENGSVAYLGVGGKNAIRHVVVAGDADAIFGETSSILMNAFR